MEQFNVVGHKHILLEFYKIFLTKHKRFMILNNDEYFDSLGKKKTLQQRLIIANEFKSETSIEEIKTKLKEYEKTCYFKIWLRRYSYS